jgi:hypothetical protein
MQQPLFAYRHNLPLVKRDSREQGREWELGEDLFSRPTRLESTL